METESVLNSLQVALEANASAYRRAVQTSAPGDCWDFVVLTAANEKQAQGYRQELALRQRAVGPTGAFFPAIQHTVVVPDPPGKRAGSGGATLGVLRALSEQFAIKPDDFQRLRILLIHSGGASQRLPAYSALGKIFAPLPLLRPDGQIATLFDHLYLTLSGLPERLGPGMLILAGDVFLLFDHRHVTTPPPGVTALTWRVPADMGRGHGVFVLDARGRIRKTLQKVDVETMRRQGATDEQDRVLIDTGLLFFDASRVQKLAGLAGIAAKGRPKRGMQERFAQQIDLYEEMAAALASGTEQHAFIADRATRPLRRELWAALHGTPFHAMQLDGEFLHLGTTRQFRDALTGRNPAHAARLLQENVLMRTSWDQAPDARVYHSLLLADENGAAGQVGAGAVIEHSILRGPVIVGAGSVVSQAAASGPLDLHEQRLLFQVPVQVGELGRRSRARSATIGVTAQAPETTSIWYVHVLCGTEDDFKGKLADHRCTYLNQPIEAWLAATGVAPDELWPDIPAPLRSLWNARLFPATPRRDGVTSAIAMLELSRGHGSALRAWRATRRYSMAMLLESADPSAMIEHRDVVAARLQFNQLLGAIERDENTPVDSLVGRFATATAYYAILEELEQRTSNKGDTGPYSISSGVPLIPPPEAAAKAALNQARAFWCAAQLLQRPDHPDPEHARPLVEAYREAAFGKVAEASEIGHRSIEIEVGGDGKLASGIEVVAAAPVRLDLSGGWTDTPPYCFERGGHVINVAINLDGRPPVRAVVRTVRQPRLILESHDLGQRIELPLIHNGRLKVDVRDPFALHKIALEMVGLTDGRDAKRRGTIGLHVTTECRVPKGSGLGTSSILGATLLAALHKLRGHAASIPQLIEQTLLLEQRLSTGGGWQDQVGGLVGGVKSTITAPGIPQRPIIEALPLSDAQYEALQDRLVVYYSGQQRLARDILRRVEGRWLAREPAVLLLTEDLKRSAAAMRVAMLKGQWAAVGREIARYWQIKKDLYPGSTTPTIDVLFLELRDDYQAAGLAGAGGGGFAYFFCKDARQARRLRERLAERSGRPGSLGTVYETQINRTGLSVSASRCGR